MRSAPFVKVGNYTNHQKYHGVNPPDCGLRIVPKYLQITYATKCFPNIYLTNDPLITVRRRQHLDESSNRIAHGRPASLGEAPWALGLTVYYNDSTGIGCSGSLVTLKWVLTAAHCFDDRNGSKWTRVEVRAGNNRYSLVGKQWSNIVEIYPHYKPPSNEHDIALVRLNDPFVRLLDWCCNDLKEYLINTICLPEPNVTNANTVSAILFGFGQLHQRRTSKWMQRGDFKIKAVGQCKFGNYTQPLEGMCSENRPWRPGKIKPEARPGDSGSGLIQYTNDDYSRAILIGVTKSAGRVPVGESYNTTFFVSVSMKMDWILKTIEKG